ncbi:unnamed protein product [Acanthoscelides obtectus]|uniref:PiggyBac transposable element-derived protein domain-containing protein n=1 Tax=Acanthoscelides obtectus TaxID=200917 RepID=A0A9P0P6L3_ACAOB|nr:unnamed protein product [Acanthoscelides obtectus]CAK1672704.1 PiggyBac transposable element-derived protein 3 [Acanthoscelides obtectus]
MAAKKKWSIAELESMSLADIYKIVEDVDEVPSDNESVLDDLDAVMSDEIPITQENADLNNDLFNLRNMDVIFEDLIEDENCSLDNAQWESDDDIPLARRNDIFLPCYWTKDTVYINKPSKFEEEAGPNLPDIIETPTDVFLHLFPEDLIDHIVFQTNLYCVQKFGDGRNFVPTTKDEIKVFFAVNLLMGVKRLPSYKDYWSSDEVLRDSFISGCISRDRFAWLLSNIHLNDNSVQPKKDQSSYRCPSITKVRVFSTSVICVAAV